jgi:hypothetical protein
MALEPYPATPLVVLGKNDIIASRLTALSLKSKSGRPLKGHSIEKAPSPAKKIHIFS